MRPGPCARARRKLCVSVTSNQTDGFANSITQTLKPPVAILRLCADTVPIGLLYVSSRLACRLCVPVQAFTVVSLPSRKASNKKPSGFRAGLLCHCLVTDSVALIVSPQRSARATAHTVRIATSGRNASAALEMMRVIGRCQLSPVTRAL